jgi:hypothetical protein
MNRILLKIALITVNTFRLKLPPQAVKIRMEPHPRVWTSSGYWQWWKLFEFCETLASRNRILPVIGFRFNSSISMIISPAWRHLYVALQRFRTRDRYISDMFSVALPETHFDVFRLATPRRLRNIYRPFGGSSASSPREHPYCIVWPEDGARKLYRNDGVYQSTKHDIPQDLHIQQHRCQSIKQTLDHGNLERDAVQFRSYRCLGERIVLVSVLNVQEVRSSEVGNNVANCMVSHPKILYTQCSLHWQPSVSKYPQILQRRINAALHHDRVFHTVPCTGHVSQFFCMLQQHSLSLDRLFEASWSHLPPPPPHTHTY